MPRSLTPWQGDRSDYASHSDADLAFFGILEFISQDPVQLDRLFRQSGLMREKWDERRGAQTYGERTLDEALRHVTETYSRGPRADLGAEASAATQGVEDAGTDRASRDDAPFSVWTVRRTPSRPY